MGKEVLTFGDIEIEKNKFYPPKTFIFLKDVDVEKVLVSNKSTISTLLLTCIVAIKLNHYI